MRIAGPVMVACACILDCTVCIAPSVSFCEAKRDDEPKVLLVKGKLTRDEYMCLISRGRMELEEAVRLLVSALKSTMPFTPIRPQEVNGLR
jgi:hypothetical protein